MSLTDAELKKLAKELLTDKEREVLTYIELMLGRASPTKSPEQEEAIRIHRNILEQAILERKWHKQRMYHYISIFLLLVVAGVIGWLIGSNKK